VPYGSTVASAAYLSLGGGGVPLSAEPAVDCTVTVMFTTASCLCHQLAVAGLLSMSACSLSNPTQAARTSPLGSIDPWAHRWLGLRCRVESDPLVVALPVKGSMSSM